jgi:hypothetical protein
MGIKEEKIVQDAVEELLSGSVPPWKVEDNLVEAQGVPPPEQFRLAALVRQKYLEQMTGVEFQYIRIPDSPYKIRLICDKDNLGYELAAQDAHRDCLFCHGQLRSLDEFAPLVANYIGGSEAYYSYAGRIKVTGDVDREYTNILVYGTGLGPIGVTRGSYMINRFGCGGIKVSASGSAARSLAFLFEKEESRQKAIRVIENCWTSLRPEMEEKMAEFHGRAVSVEFGRAGIQQGYVLFVEFVMDFENFRGHGDTSRSVGWAKGKIEEELRQKGVEFSVSIIAQGYDGDLKPSPRNKRGRFVQADVRIPHKEFEETFGISVERFLTSVEMDRLGAEKLGCPFYSGMGGEIIPAVYKAAKINPQSSLVSSFQIIFTRSENGDLVYGVQLPNVEAGRFRGI